MKNTENAKNTENVNQEHQIQQSSKSSIHKLLLVQTLIIVLLGSIIFILVKNSNSNKSNSNQINIQESLINDLTKSSSKSNNDVATNQSNQSIVLLKIISLSDGTYTVGTDIAAGIYNLEAESGLGLISGDLKNGYFSEIMGSSSDFDGYEEYYSETYNNLRLYDGDVFEIESGVTIEFVPIS